MFNGPTHNKISPQYHIAFRVRPCLNMYTIRLDADVSVSLSRTIFRDGTFWLEFYDSEDYDFHIMII